MFGHEGSGGGQEPAEQPSSGAAMPPTDIRNPDYFHKVVDCQWACPAHTPVPEYIRLIAAGRYADAYHGQLDVERLPGHPRPHLRPPVRAGLPARPRRGRAGGDLPPEARRRRQQGRHRRVCCPRAPATTNGKRVALIGAGPASLTVARDLAPLGYDIVLIDSEARGGGMIRSQIPRFRLPEKRHRRGGRLHRRHRRHRDALRPAHRQPQGAARRGLRRDLRRHRRAARPRPRRAGPQGGRGANIHIGIDWLSSVSFGHIEQDRPARHRARRRQHRDGLLPHLAPPRRRGREGRRPLRLRGDEGVALGEGGRDARRHPDPQLPRAQGIHAQGRPADRRRSSRRSRRDTTTRAAASSCRPASRTCTIACDDVLIAIGQENAFPWIERDIGLEFDQLGHARRSTRAPCSRRLPNVFFGGDAAFGPKNIIWAVAHGHEAAISIDRFCRGESVARAAAAAW